MKESNSIYGLQYENGKYSLIEFQGDRSQPLRQYSKKEVFSLMQEVNPDAIKAHLNSILNTVPKEFENQFM